jgi:hypothetical protein
LVLGLSFLLKYIHLKYCPQDNSVLTDAQFGFRPGYGTHDAIFALHSIISKSLRQGKRLYCRFIDYMAYKNGDNDSPCTKPILRLKKSEKLPSCFTLDFNLEYIDLIRSKSFPFTPLALMTQSLLFIP